MSNQSNLISGLPQDFKLRVISKLKDSRSTFGASDAKFATSLDINPAQLSRILNGDIAQVLSDGKWISLARVLNVNLRNEAPWKTAETPAFVFITTQLKKCKKDSLSLLLCDETDIGKTHTAKHFTATNQFTVYIDCSQVKSKQKLLRKIAREFGVSHTGKYADVYEDLVFYLNSISHCNPLVILDEAGDLNYDAFLELKALWNATEGACGWFMMGADGLREKIRRAIDNKKVGYAEIFRRYGKRYQKATPEGAEEHKTYAMKQAALVIKANAPEGTNLDKILKQTEGSLTRIRHELSKLR